MPLVSTKRLPARVKKARAAKRAAISAARKKKGFMPWVPPPAGYPNLLNEDGSEPTPEQIAWREVPARGPTGRHTLLPPLVVVKRMCDSLTASVAIDDVMTMAGISHAKWQELDARYRAHVEKGVFEYPDVLGFVAAIKKAQTGFEDRSATIIANDPSWQSQAWLLERRLWKKYGKKDTSIHVGSDDKRDAPIRIEYVNHWRQKPTVDVTHKKKGSE
jgi:hypothetical protein